MDIYTNFICIIFCDKLYKDKYLMICSFLDERCRNYWTKVVLKNQSIDDRVPEKQMNLQIGLQNNLSSTAKDNVSHTGSMDVGTAV